jgi:ribonuclease P protein subunit RPR2
VVLRLNLRRDVSFRRGSRLRRAQTLLAQHEDNYELTVEALAAALELRDDETGGHARRVTRYALELTRVVDSELARDPELRYGFLLHDIGKIGVPDAILLKPGPLSPEEMRRLQEHITLGEQLVSGIPFLSGVAREVIAFHHERWDGLGYVRGLREQEIPLAARIFAVADSFDAMTSDRPYRAALSVEPALTEIGSMAGSQFDPTVVAAFLTIGPGLAERLRRFA